MLYLITSSGDGRLAQLVRALALQARGHRFESYIAHHLFFYYYCRNSSTGRATDLWDRVVILLNYLAPL